MALKGTKLARWCSFKHKVPDLCYMVLKALLQPSCGHCLMCQKAPAIPAQPLQHQQQGLIWELGPEASLSRWINQKSCETLDYRWAEMTANLIYLSSLIFLLAGGNLKPFELVCECSHCHLPAEVLSSSPGQGCLGQRAEPGPRGHLPHWPSPSARFCTEHGHAQPKSQLADTCTLLAFRSHSLHCQQLEFTVAPWQEQLVNQIPPMLIDSIASDELVQ